jgi:2-C-methyl-D-erythritol 4-phosphate cytidylyltransferase
MKKVAIIVAGGSGSRMNAPLPKQFLNIANEPILFHTLRKFEDIADQIILVMHPEWILFWSKIISDSDFKVKHSLVAGGNNRAQSVLNGLNLIEELCLVAVHDAARPLVSKKLIVSTYENALLHDACIPVVELKESIRQVLEDSTSFAVDRSKFRVVQTPQTFKSSVLKTAFQTNEFEKYTDEASLVEASGKKIFLIEGEVTNFKITSPEDLTLAKNLI